MRTLGKLEQVDVILRRVDSTWMDALELRPGSRLGVTGLLECVRQGTVSVVNNLGSGVLENPALLPFLPELCERLLGEPLRLPSVDTWWCGDEASLSHVLANLERIVVRPISRGHGRSVLGAALTAGQREQLMAKLQGGAAPVRRPGGAAAVLGADQPRPTPWSAGTWCCGRSRCAAGRRTRRCSVVWPGSPTTSVAGAPPLVTDPDGGLAKDVWVVSREPVAAGPAGGPARPGRGRGRPGHRRLAVGGHGAAGAVATCSGSAGTPSGPRTCCG